MCFSASASFIASGLLTGLGGASIVQSSSRAQRPFAAIPLLFAAQQAAEGTVWLTMGEPASTLHRLGVSAFLAFAMVVWPTWLPFSLRQIERSATRRRLLSPLLWFGAAVSTYAAFLLVQRQPVASIAGHSLRYDYARREDAASRVVYMLGYLIPIIVPFFVSTTRLSRVIGGVLIGALIVTTIARRDALTSVWCFFAALLSGLILAVVLQEQRVADPARLA